MTSPWVTSTFDAEAESGVAKKRGVSFGGESSSSSPSEYSLSQGVKESWVDKHNPTTKDKLAVHKKKIEEVEWWLSQSLKRQVGSILLLTGPSGSGKTATVKVLCKDLGADVREWLNPLTQVQWTACYGEDDYRQGGSTMTQQVKSFKEFLLRASRFNPVCTQGSGAAHKKLLLVEDMPNIFFLKPGELHNILRKYLVAGKCPIVFIVTDATSSDSNARLLFPKKAQEECSIYNICFNPVAPTAMVKALERIVQLERASCRLEIPSKETLLSIAESSGGDVRSAVNTLQFSFQKGVGTLKTMFTTSEGPSKSKMKKRGDKTHKQTSKSKKDGTTPVGGRDISMFLFRALGKILHCKRLEEPSNEIPKLPDHLNKYERYPPTSDPDEIFHRTQVSADSLSMFLQENYLDFIVDVDSIVTAADCLSVSDVLKMWEEKNVLEEISACVTIRGIMFSNKGGPGVGWRSLRKPHWYTVVRESNSRFCTASYLFEAWHTSKVEAVTELIPFLSIINTSFSTVECCAFVQELGRFQGRCVVGPQGQTLHESDPGEQNTAPLEDFAIKSNIDIQQSVPQSESEEEYNIEEYED